MRLADVGGCGGTRARVFVDALLFFSGRPGPVAATEDIFEFC